MLKPHTGFDWFDIGEVVVGLGFVATAIGLVRYRGALRRARAEGEARYRSLVEAAPFGIVVHDERDVRYVNHLGRVLLGLPDEGLPPVAALGEIVAPPATAGVDPWPVRLAAADGSWREFRTQAIASTFDGKPARMAFFRDMTASRRAEQRLEVRGRLAGAFLAGGGQELRSRLGEVLQDCLGAPCSCVGMFDMAGRLRLACNCGTSDGSVEHRDLAPAEVPAALQRILEAAGPLALAETGPGPGQPQAPLLGAALAGSNRVMGLVAVGGRPGGYHADDAELLAGIAADLAPLVQAHLAAEAKDTQLAQSQKMEALGVLAGGIAHDFNNILQAILGFSTLARQDAHDPARLAADLDRVQRATVRGRDLVQRILLFSRPGEPEAPPLDPLPLLEEIALELRTTLPRNTRVESALDADCGLVRAAAPQLRQIVMNLATNAAQAVAPTGGAVTLGCRAWDVPPGDGRLPGEWHGRKAVLLTVADTGPGIPAGHRARLFDPFFTTREVGQGTGLGLSVVHGLVTGLGGRVWIDCPAGGGTIATVCLPRVADAGHPVPPVATGEPAAPAEAAIAGRVLFVDDDPEIRDLAVAMLERSGYRVEAARDGQEACDRLAAGAADFDVVVTDQYMPGLTGRELAQRVAAMRPGLPVILVTGLDEPSEPTVARGLVFREVVTKPFFGQSLCLAVRRAVEARRATGPEPLDSGR